MSPVDTYNKQILKLWSAHVPHDTPAKWKATVPVLIPAGAVGNGEWKARRKVVFTGMNPSFNLNAVKCLLGQARLVEQDFDWAARRRMSPTLQRKILAFEALARDSYNVYFEPIKRFGAAVNIDMAKSIHLDLLAMRGSDQAKLKDILNETASEFIDGQTQAYANLLAALRPHLVFILNAEATRRIAAELQLEKEADPRWMRVGAGTPYPALKGTRFIALPQLKYPTSSLVLPHLEVSVRDMLAKDHR